MHAYAIGFKTSLARDNQDFLTYFSPGCSSVDEKKLYDRVFLCLCINVSLCSSQNENPKSHQHEVSLLFFAFKVSCCRLFISSLFRFEGLFFRGQFFACNRMATGKVEVSNKMKTGKKWLPATYVLWRHFSKASFFHQLLLFLACFCVTCSLKVLARVVLCELQMLRLLQGRASIIVQLSNNICAYSP